MVTEDTLGFCTEYMSRFTGTRRCVWDAGEEQAMIDEVMEGKGVRREMSEQYREWTHNFVLENTMHLEDWRRYGSPVLPMSIDVVIQLHYLRAILRWGL
jgi:hypothetical protein